MCEDGQHAPEEIHAAEHEFLEEMAEKYKECPKAYSKRKGLLPEAAPLAMLGTSIQHYDR